jgi:BirA family transcriptional regulator, biotin operon repressor / biotin---[acetyl-CoA-carboxylase] ligase
MSSPLPAEFEVAIRRLPHPPASVYFYPETTSTNDLAATLADRGAAEGTLVLADMQTAGRGRLGRTWASPAGAGIYASLILRPELQVAALLTIAAGVAIAGAIEAATGLSPHLKWPNDVVITDRGAGASRKIAGILAESGTTAASRWVVVGFGINVLPAAYPPEVAGRATSLEGELGRHVDRGLVLAECLRMMRDRYDELNAGRAADVLQAWRARAAPMVGRRVEWQADGEARQGIATDIDETGALVISNGSGLVRVMSGEVRWI